MPEASEVRLTTDFLNSSLKDKKIINWIFTGDIYNNNYPSGYEEFYNDLPLNVDEVNCNGKLIYFKLSSRNKKYFILHSLMLSGRWQKMYDNNCKWFVEIDDGQTFWFRDIKSLATIKFTPDEEVLKTHLSILGPDIMRADFKLPNFRILIKKCSTYNICSFLIDQTVISGVGNYIKAEVLYDAKVSPFRQVGTLNDAEIDLLYQALYVISRISYNNRGLSIGDYTDENGQKGQHNRVLKIYGKSFATKTKTPDGYVTYWDPSIQR